MEMFNAGFSIIEISKVLKISVGEVKKIIDNQQGE
jgi:DNA-directed RNA polymerase specialized sigma24 family protein